MRHQFPKDPIKFFTETLEFKPTKYQNQLTNFFKKNQFVAARWCRQSGKSHIIAALLLHYALVNEDTYIGVVGPSWRQTKLIIRRINTFLRKLHEAVYRKPQRTIVRLSNGSIIEAFPNNPDTIRGPTLHIVYCDEMNFIPHDEEMYDAILFTLSTTDGKFICSSTPWNTDSVFYKIFNHKDYKDFKRSHVTWQDATEPKGPLKKSILKKIQRQFRGDPWRWKREMEAEWAEDESVWLPQALITSCIDQALNPIDFDEHAKGNFFMGVDLGKYRDYSVVTVVQREKDALKLVHIKRFPLKTAYASVIGYIKTLCDRWKTLHNVSVDMTGVGDYIVEDMKNAGIHQVEGVKFTLPTKEKLATNLKQRMLDGVFKIPYVPVRYSSRDVDLMVELNVERFELRKTENIVFSHPEGSHDDVFWSIALALHAARGELKGDKEAFIFH
jgi:phage FluMu gp28-like protein